MPGTAGAAGAVNWLSRPARAVRASVAERFRAALPGLGERTLVNQVLTIPGRLPSEIVVMAHRDDNGTGPGANDNASGIAALLELARSYGTPVARPAPGARSTRWSSSRPTAAPSARSAPATSPPPMRDRACGGRPRRDRRPRPAAHRPHRHEPRLASSGFVETASERVLEQSGQRPDAPGALAQLIDLGFPFTLHEQGPLLARGMPALTLTSGGERRRRVLRPAVRLDACGSASWPCRTAAPELARLRASSSRRGRRATSTSAPRILPGWAIELVLIAALPPFLVAAVDLFARCRRRHIPLAPALRSYRSRADFWLDGDLRAVRADRRLAAAPAVPLPPDSTPATTGPSSACSGSRPERIGWLVAAALLPSRAGLAGRGTRRHDGGAARARRRRVLVVATNPFALIFLLPSLHAWLWLPHVRGRPFWTRAGRAGAGFLGPLLLLGSFAFRFGLGLDSVWYLAELAATGYAGLPALVIAAGWLAAAGQVAALAAGRYAPYPTRASGLPAGRSERPSGERSLQ